MDNEEVPPADQDVPGVPKKGGKSWLLMVGALVIAGASSAAGATLGPTVKQKLFAPKPASGEEHDEKADEKGAHIVALESLVVDVRDDGGDTHHVKVGIALEIGEPVQEEEWKVDVVPRVRDATIGYLRSLKFDEAATSAKFETIRTELQERIAKAVKKPKVRRVFFVDYVVQ